MAFSLRPGAAKDDKEAAKPETGAGLLRFLLSLALIAWAIRSFIIATFYIPTPSMVPTLYIGDYLFVTKWNYGYSRYSFPFGFPKFDGRILGGVPKRGDVIVFRHPVEDEDLIKRAIGLPGDTIALVDGAVILNGQPLRREALRDVNVAVSPNSPCRRILPQGAAIVRGVEGQCAYSAFRETLPGGPSYTVLDQARTSRDNLPPVTVPAGHLFVMGDNRDDSLDSRYSAIEGGVGFLPVDHVIGRAAVTVWSTDGSANYFLPWTWFTALRGTRLGNGYTGDAE